MKVESTSDINGVSTSCINVVLSSGNRKCTLAGCLVVLAVLPLPPLLSGAYFRVAATGVFTSDSVLPFTDFITLAIHKLLCCVYTILNLINKITAKMGKPTNKTTGR